VTDEEIDQKIAVLLDTVGGWARSSARPPQWIERGVDAQSMRETPSIGTALKTGVMRRSSGCAASRGNLADEEIRAMVR
jgi:hypothetical protein